jgi:serine protease inhibitor
MPGLKLDEWGGDLVEPLRAAGLGTALGSAGDYRALTRARASVGEVVHRVVFEADEEGAVGAAATAAVGTAVFYVRVRPANGRNVVQACVADPGRT